MTLPDCLKITQKADFLQLGRSIGARVKKDSVAVNLHSLCDSFASEVDAPNVCIVFWSASFSLKDINASMLTGSNRKIHPSVILDLNLNQSKIKPYCLWNWGGISTYFNYMVPIFNKTSSEGAWPEKLTPIKVQLPAQFHFNVQSPHICCISRIRKGCGRF